MRQQMLVQFSPMYLTVYELQSSRGMARTVWVGNCMFFLFPHFILFSAYLVFMLLCERCENVFKNCSQKHNQIGLNFLVFVKPPIHCICYVNKHVPFTLEYSVLQIQFERLAKLFLNIIQIKEEPIKMLILTWANFSYHRNKISNEFL